MPAAKLAFLILLVASPLPRLLDFDLVPGSCGGVCVPEVTVPLVAKEYTLVAAALRRQIQLRTLQFYSKPFAGC
jgi:hypothetical protein